MTTDITSPVGNAAETEGFLGEDWFDPLEARVRTRIRSFIEELLEAELEAALGRKRYERGRTPEEGPGAEAARSPVSGHRHGRRERTLMGTFGAVTVCVPRARLATPEGGTTEWRNATVPAYQRLTRRAEALIAGAYLSGTNTCGVGRTFKSDWDAWARRDLSAEPIIRLILDGTVVRVRLDRKATAISLLVVLGVRRDGQKVLLAVKNMGGESEAAWRAILDDLIARGLRTPAFVIVDGAPGLEKALAALWPDVPAQRCTVHKHRNLLAHAPDRLHDEVSADYTDMIYAATPTEITERRKAFLRKWRLKCRAVADSLEEAGDKLFTFTRLPPSQWKSARTTNAVERLHEEFKRRIKTQTVLPSAETAAMLFWALLASGQITMRKVDGWATLAETPTDPPIDLAA
jgi:putative transposase